MNQNIRGAAPSVAVAYHDQLAEGWDQRYLAGSFRRRAEFISRHIFPAIPANRLYCLDVGCGTGRFARILARNEAQIVGVDGSPNMVHLAKELAKREGLEDRASFQTVNSVEQLPFAEGQFDYVMSLSVLEYLSDPDQCLKEMGRVLKPGGSILVSVPNRSSAVRRGQRFLRRFIDRREYSSIAYLESSLNSWNGERLKRSAAAQGIVCEKILGFDPFLPQWVWRLFPPSMLFFIGRKASADTSVES